MTNLTASSFAYNGLCFLCRFPCEGDDLFCYHKTKDCLWFRRKTKKYLVLYQHGIFWIEGNGHSVYTTRYNGYSFDFVKNLASDEAIENFILLQ